MLLTRLCTILSALLLLAPAAAWGENCNFEVGDSGYYSTVVTGAGFESGEPCTPDSTDLFTIKDGARVFVTNNVGIVGSGAEWVVDEGGELLITTTSPRDPMYFQGNQGGSYPEGSTTIAIDGTMTVRGSYRQFGVESPVPQAERLYRGHPRKDVVWTIESVGVCGGAAGTVGANCNAAGSSDKELSLYWTDAASNPMDDSTGDTFLEESVGDVQDGVAYHTDMWCAWDLDPDDDYVPGEIHQCYDIDDVTTATPYAFDLDMRQVSVLEGEDPSGYPIARREIMGVDLESAASAGDTCIDVDDGSVLVDNDYVGRYFMVEDTLTWYRPLKILGTQVDVDCAGLDTSGGDDSDSILFSRENPIPEDIPLEVGGANEAIIGYGFRPGDHGFVMVPVRMDETGPGPTDARFYASGTLNWNGVMVGSLGRFHLDGATLERFSDVYFYDCGSNSHCMELEGTPGAVLKSVTFVGTASNDDPSPVYVNGMTGTLSVADVGFRYYREDAILTTGEGTAGAFRAKRMTCGSKLKTGVSAAGCFDDSAKAFASVDIKELYVEDAVTVVGGSGAVITGASDGPEIRVDKAMFWGISGAMSSGNVKMENPTARGITAANTSAILPRKMDHFDIEGVDATALTGTLNGSTATDYRNGRFHDIDNHGEDLFYCGAGHVFSNIEFSDFETDATCTSGECDVIACTFDNDTSTVDVMERLTFTLGDGEETTFANMIHEVSGLDADATGTRVGGILCAGIDASSANQDAYCVDFDSTTKVGYLDTSAGDFCAYDNSANGTGDWYDVHATALSAYAGIYHTGYPVSFEDSVSSQFGLVGGIQELWKCGARTGQWRPGVHHRDAARLWSRIGIVPPDLVTIVNKHGGGGVY